MYALLSSDDLGRKVVLPIRKVMTVLGRDPACDIVLIDDNVSRRHAKIYLMENLVQIKDMGSRNGTFLNNARIECMKPLKAGDEIIIGSNQFHLIEQAGAGMGAPELTGIRTMDQLREPMRGFDVRPGQDAPRPAAELEGERTMIAAPDDMMADIYGKKLALAHYASVEVLFGKSRGARYLLPPGRFVIGRADDCNIKLDDEKVSGRHGAIDVAAGVLYEDLGSTNGSILNNRLVKKSAPLRHKDILLLGDTKLKFLDPKNAPMTAKLNKEGASDSQISRGDGGLLTSKWFQVSVLAAAVVLDGLVGNFYGKTPFIALTSLLILAAGIGAFFYFRK